MFKKPMPTSAIHLTGTFAAASVLLAVSSSAFAQPLVTGNEISWPDNGWYQVQTTDTYESICNGGSSCIVSAGIYKVVNHSTGERFRVEVTNASTPIDSEPSDGGGDRVIDGVVRVSGNTLSWPDNGWYQVQNIADNSEICSGVTQCEVAAGGSYRVINHTNGTRYGPIEIGDTTQETESTSLDYAITGNQIEWFNEGWHQLQNAETYESVCEGRVGTICIVSPGIYKLINHSTGQRFGRLEVLADSSTTESLDAIPTDVQGVAYTDTEIELFWQRANNTVAVSGYDIIRNGTLVAASLDALSYYDNSVEPGTSYEYQVIAVDSSGLSSDAVVVRIDTPAQYTTINTDNYLALSEYLLSISQASFTESSVAMVDSYSNDAIYASAPFAIIDTQYDPESSRVSTEYSCGQGGSYINTPTGSALGGETGDFSNCSYADTQIDGTYSLSNDLSKFTLNPGLTTDINYDLAAFTQSGSSTVELKGSSSIFNGTYQQVTAWYVERFMSPSFNGMTQITNFNYRSNAGTPLDASGEASAFEGSITSSFRIQAPDTGNKPITYSTTNTLLKNSLTGNYESGNILATGNDGSSLSIEFGTGDSNTAAVTVNTTDYTFTDTVQISDFM